MAPVLYADYAANGYILLNALLTLGSGPLFGFTEFKAKGLKYSKFAAEGKLLGSIPSKLAMFLYYAPAAAVSGMVLLQTTTGFPGPLSLFQDYQPSFRFLVLNTAIFIHFTKRVLEVLFLHKYSGNAELLSSALIVFFYTYLSANLLYAQKVCDQLTPPAVNLLPLGVVFFLVGVAGNFYHHYLLAQLRSGSAEEKHRYVVPHGGLFELVTCPHYLFEIIDFCGLAMISQSTLGLATFFFVAIYLTTRSISTRRWYMKKIEGFPTDRKAVFPFVL